MPVKAQTFQSYSRRKTIPEPTVPIVFLAGYSILISERLVRTLCHIHLDLFHRVHIALTSTIMTLNGLCYVQSISLKDLAAKPYRSYRSILVGYSILIFERQLELFATFILSCFIAVISH